MLIQERNIGFEAVIDAMDSGRLLDVLPHPDQKTYPHQRLYILDMGGYVYVVPFVIDEEKKEIFLKTIFPSRKMTAKYLGGQDET